MKCIVLPVRNWTLTASALMFVCAAVLWTVSARNQLREYVW